LKRIVCCVVDIASLCGVGFTTPPQALVDALDSDSFEWLSKELMVRGHDVKRSAIEKQEILCG
jgi:hypothetical protein